MHPAGAHAASACQQVEADDGADADQAPALTSPTSLLKNNFHLLYVYLLLNKKLPILTRIVN